VIRILQGAFLVAEAMASLIAIFRQMPDPRKGNARRHDLLDILTIALAASPCGAQSWVGFVAADADHGRVETRRHRATHDADWLFGDRAEPDAPRMPDVAALACVGAARDGGPPKAPVGRKRKRTGWSDAFARTVIGRMR
jgi:hypothetical protein